MRTLLGALTALALVLGSTSASAAPCDRLSAADKKRAAKLFASTYPYDCCDETLDKCLKAKKVCKLAKRLRDSICRRLSAGEDEKSIKNALDRRARSMTPAGKKAVIDLGSAPPAGDPAAKVAVVAYACARCPYCSKVVPNLYQMVTAGPLKDKVVLYFRPFPIRGHEGSVEGGLAFVAAEKLGKLWPMLLKIYADYDAFAASKLPTWADAVGMDKAKFEALMKAPATRKALVEAKKEGLRNGVDATPTLFIDGRRYYGDLEREVLLDVLDEAADRAASKQFCGK